MTHRFALCLLLAVASCATDGPYVWVESLAASKLTLPPYRVVAGDKLFVSVWNQAPLSGEVVVRSDGNITLPLIGDILVLGATPTQVSELVVARLTGLVVDARVSVSVAGVRESMVSVVGEVRQSGAHPLRHGEGVLELLARAGGLSEFADRNRVFVIRRSDAMRVRFNYDKLSRSDGPGIAFMLHDGDVVVVE